MMGIENITLILSAFITGTLFLAMGVITWHHAFKKKNNLVYLFSVNWLFQALFWYFVSSAHLCYSTILMTVGFIFHGLGIYCFFIFIELIQKESVNLLKFTVLLVIETFYISFAFLPDSMEIIPEYGIHITGYCRFFQVILILLYVYIYFSWCVRTWKRAPEELKQVTRYFLLGSVIATPMTVLFYIIGTFISFFGIATFIVHATGNFITVLVIRKEPKLMYILPFKAYRLIVFETNSGIALYSHNWAEKKGLDESYFAMVFQGIGTILNEILHQGIVREIHMDKAILMVQYDTKHPIASVLVATKASKSLRYGLKSFHDKFISQFSDELNSFYEISKFKGARNIVDEVFEFIPDYKNNV